MSTDQCVLISGEAGSGKTESAKLTLQYLAAVTGHAKEFHNIKYQLLQSNSVLEGKPNISKTTSGALGAWIERKQTFNVDTTYHVEFCIWVIVKNIILVSVKVTCRFMERS